MCATRTAHPDQSSIPTSVMKAGWTGVLVAARYGFADIVRELITTYGCDRNAKKHVSG